MKTDIMKAKSLEYFNPYFMIIIIIHEPYIAINMHIGKQLGSENENNLRLSSSNFPFPMCIHITMYGT